MKRKLLFVLIGAFILTVTLYFVPDRAAAGKQDAKPVEVKIDPAKFDDYVGQYAIPNKPDVVLSFFREGEKYYVQATNQGRFEIFAASESKFFVKAFDAQVDFVRDAQRKVTGIVWQQEGFTTNASKISNQPLVQPNVPFDKHEE